MREIEIKAHVYDFDKVFDLIEKKAGKGTPVDKEDRYFHIEGNTHPALRIRRFNGHMEFTTKKNSKDSFGENNLEYEITLGIDQYDNAVTFFKALGYKDYFIKRKKGFDWMLDNVHIELLNVNDLGWFLEMENLLPFDSEGCLIEEAGKQLHDLLHIFSLTDDDIERKSYRSMILGE